MSTSNCEPVYETAKAKHLQAQCYRGRDEVRRMSLGCLIGLVSMFIPLGALMPHDSGIAEAVDPPPATSTRITGGGKGVYWREISLDEYARKESDDVVPANVSSYLAANCCKDQISIVSLLERARQRAVRAGFTPPSLLMACCIARWETGATWDINARGKAGERGLLQIHPIHDSSMRKAGLDPLDVNDQLLYGMMLYSWQGLKPWAVKIRAQRDYREWAE